MKGETYESCSALGDVVHGHPTQQYPVSGAVDISAEAYCVSVRVLSSHQGGTMYCV